MIWDAEVLRVDGNLYAYIRVQNEFTGNISGTFRRIYKNKDGYYAQADGKKNYLNSKVDALLAHEARQKDITDFYNKYKNQIGGYR